MTWINIAKPTGSSYTNLNTAKPSYDEPTLSYDDSSTYYNGSNQAAYTNIAKPVDGVNGFIRAGMITGLLMPLTYSTNYNLHNSAWTNINKPT